MKNGLTDYNDIGRIDLFPNAFSDEEQLIRTVIHEECHVKQLKNTAKNMHKSICKKWKNRLIVLKAFIITF